MDVIDACIDDHGLRSECEEVASQIGARRWVVLLHDQQRCLRVGEPDPLDALLSELDPDEVRNLDRVDPDELGPVGSRLGAAGIQTISTMPVDVVQGTAFFFDARHPLHPAPAPISGASLVSELRLAAWTRELPAIAAGNLEPLEVMTRMCEAFDFTAAVLRFPGRRGIVTLGCHSSGDAGPGSIDRVDFEADWTQVLDDPDGAFEHLPGGRAVAPWRRAVRSSDDRVVLGAEGPADPDRTDLVLVADLLAPSLQHAMVGSRAAVDEHIRATERTRLAAVLHEELSQRLSTLAVQIDLLSNRPHASAVVGDLAELRSGLVDSLEALRSAIFTLTPPEPSWEDLTEGLATFVADHAASRDVSASLRCTGDPRPVEPDLVSLVFATAQEGITNAAKHAGVETVDVALAFQASSLVVTVSDDGAGSDADLDARVDRKHQGLAVLRSRARLHGAHLDFDSHPGRGSRLSLRAPTAQLPAVSNTAGATAATGTCSDSPRHDGAAA